MGKQTTFYMDRIDEAEFVKFFRSTGDVAILPQTSCTELKEEFRDFTEAEGRPLSESCVLWNRSISLLPVVNYVPQQRYYCVDSLQSEVVDVWRCKVTSRGLSMGRLWMEPKILGGDGKMQSKGAAFDAWFTTLSRWIKNNGVRVIDGAQVLPGAAALATSGTELTGHVP